MASCYYDTAADCNYCILDPLDYCVCYHMSMKHNCTETSHNVLNGTEHHCGNIILEDNVGTEHIT